MIEQFERYGEYRDSGIEWLGKIPRSWKMLANKYIFKVKKDIVGKRAEEYDLLSLTLNGIIRRDMENPQGKFPTEFDTYQEVKKGDFIFCLFDVEETPRTVGISPFDGMITGAYTVMKANEAFYPKYLYYFYLHLDEHKLLKPLYKGLRNTISKDNFFAFKSFVPSFQEQQSIANFLDQKTQQIDHFIQLKEKTIALLEERKAAIINQAVTKGLDPNVPMKDSGIEWLGEIPEHWKTAKNKTIFKEKSIAGKAGLPILSVSIHSGVSEKELKKEENIRGRIRIENKTSYKLVKQGFIVFNMMRAWQGSIGAVSSLGMVSPAYIVAEPNKSIYSKYFEFLYRTKPFILQMDKSSKGITDFRKRLYWDNFKDLITIVPPLKEQKQITKKLLEFSNSVDKSVSLISQQITLIKEYRASLISAAVTGKIKVSE